MTAEAALASEKPTEGMAEGLGLEDSGDQYLTFIMAGEEYGVDILQVQEIRGWEPATPIPNAPAHIKGVINLRGAIVPIIDLRQCFGMDEIEYGPLTVVIVLRIDNDKGSRVVGIVVDAVSEVYNVRDEDIRSTPTLGDSVNTEYLRGLATLDEKMVVLLEINHLMSLDDVSDFAHVAIQARNQNS